VGLGIVSVGFGVGVTGRGVLEGAGVFVCVMVATSVGVARTRVAVGIGLSATAAGVALSSLGMHAESTKAIRTINHLQRRLKFLSVDILGFECTIDPQISPYFSTADVELWLTEFYIRKG
jgi:hypothetical protein